MILKKHEIQILKLLISSTDFISTYDIAISTGISRRVVREEISDVKAIIETLGYSLISKPSKGYFLENKSYEMISKIQSLIIESDREKESLFPTLPNERQNYILKRLIDTNDYMKLDVLANELLVSRSTISNDIAIVRKNIKKYRLSLLQRPNYGILLEGDEISRRKVLSDYIFTTLRIAEMFYDFLDTWTASSDYQVIQIIKNYKIEMSDVGLIDFLLNLSISIGRVSNGYTIQHGITNFNIFLDRNEYKAATEIAQYIEKYFHLYYNEYEIQNITLLLICKRSTKGLTPSNHSIVNTITQHVIDEIKKQTLITFHNKNFDRILPLYIENALLRQKYNEKIRNPLFEEIKMTYPLAYELALITSTVIEKYSHQKLSRSELTAFAILFNNIIQEQSIQKRKVLLLSALGYAADNLCLFLINEKFSNCLKITKVTQYYQLDEENLNNYDLVISTVPIHRNLPIPHINVNYVMNQDDLNKIDSHLSYFFDNKNLIYYFHPKLYQNHVQVKSKKGVITTLYQLLKYVYPHLKDTFKNELSLESSHTMKVFNNQIGFIKLHKPISSYNSISVIILENSIIWNKEKVQIVILYSCLDNENIMYNSLYNTLNLLSLNEKAMNELLSHPNYTHFLEILKEHKQNSLTPPLIFK